jgi:hypothetical protein
MGGVVPILVFNATNKPVVITAVIAKGMILIAVQSFVKSENKTIALAKILPVAGV